MGTLTISERSRRRQVHARIRHLTNAAIDWDIEADDARADVDRAVERLKIAVANRDAAIYQLGLFVADTAA